MLVNTLSLGWGYCERLCSTDPVCAVRRLRRDKRCRFVLIQGRHDSVERIYDVDVGIAGG